MFKLFLYEFLGSFVITFFGAFSWINNLDSFISIASTYFFLILGLTYASKKISGAYFNPILTISMLFTK